MFPFRPLAYQCSNENKHLNALLHVQDFQLLGKKKTLFPPVPEKLTFCR